MKCKIVENNIINGSVNNTVLEHINSCDDCKIYYELHQHQAIDFIVSDGLIEHQVNEAVKASIKIAKRKERLSTLLFIITALLITSTVAFAMITNIESLGKVYYFILSGLMPFSMPIITVVRKKVF
jgi:hypothetical protein